jgi:hypothetical protein
MRARLVGLLIFSLLLVGHLFFGCNAQTGGPTPPPPRDGGTVDPEYCTKYCDAEENSGTLMGTLAECISMCCMTVPAGCSGADSGLGSDTGANKDTGGNVPDTGAPDGGCIPCGTGSCCNSGTQTCMGGSCVSTCRSSGDCSSGCCAPATNSNGDPIGPYVCKPNDAKPYDCCTGLFNDCDSTHCCVTDPNNNEFCVTQCTQNSQCGAASCIGGFDFGDTTTCSSSTGQACGP